MTGKLTVKILGQLTGKFLKQSVESDALLLQPVTRAEMKQIAQIFLHFFAVYGKIRMEMIWFQISNPGTADPFAGIPYDGSGKCEDPVDP